MQALTCDERPELQRLMVTSTSWGMGFSFRSFKFTTQACDGAMKSLRSASLTAPEKLLISFSSLMDTKEESWMKSWSTLALQHMHVANLT